MSKISKPLVATLGLALVCAMSLPAQDTPKERTVVTVDLEAQQGVDSNGDGRGLVSHFQQYTPRFEFHQSFKRGSWFFDYRPTVRAYSGSVSRNQVDQQVGMGTNFQFSPRWTLDFRSSFLHGSNPFLRLQGDTTGPPTSEGVLFGPSRAFAGPERRFTNWNSDLTLRYALGANRSVKLSAGYTRSEEQTSLLVDQESLSWRVEYSQQYARNKAWAVLYSWQHFRISAADQRVVAHSLLLFHTYEIRPGTRLALFVGPQLSLINARPTLNLGPIIITIGLRGVTTGAAFGAMFTQRFTERTWLDVNLSRRVSDGGGFSGPAVQDAGRLTLRRNLTGRLSASVSGYLTDNRALENLGPNPNWRTVGFSAGADYALNRRLTVTTLFELSRFTSVSEELRPLLSQHRFTAGLRYSFGSFPLGR